MSEIRFAQINGIGPEFDEKTNLDIFDACAQIRGEVFIVEQGYEEEFDGTDNVATHVLMLVDEKPAGCGRVFKNFDNLKEHIIGRVCILKEYRGHGLGSVLLKGIEESVNGKIYKLHAQEDKKVFYEKNGYSLVDDTVDLDEGVPHVWMSKIVKR